MDTLYYLTKYYRIYGKLRVAFCNRKTKQWIHTTYPSEEFNKFFGKKLYTLHRQIMHDEIVIETDLYSWYDNSVINLGIVDKCLSNMWKFSSWTSGNKSFHTHLFFPQLRKIKQRHKLKSAKELFIKWFFDDLDKKEDEETNCERLKVDLLTGKQLIRAEYQLHEKTKRNKIPIVEHYKDEKNIMPKEVVLIFNKKEKIKVKKFIPNTQLPCINILLSTPLKDGRKRVMFILAAHLKTIMTQQQLTQLLMLWSNKKQQGLLTYGNISGCVNNQYRTKSKPGCRYIKQVLTDAGLKSMCRGCKYGRD